jgi:hypothetical protein
MQYRYSQVATRRSAYFSLTVFPGRTSTPSTSGLRLPKMPSGQVSRFVGSLGVVGSG